MNLNTSREKTQKKLKGEKSGLKNSKPYQT
jgi:hypothetical protein